jgi:hypothetical protein
MRAMANPDGFSQTLVASHPQNTSAVRSGVWSRTGRILQPRAEEIASRLHDAPFVTAADSIGIEEIASTIAVLEAIDRELADGLMRRGRDRTALLRMRATFSRRLEGWLAHYGWTPRSRGELAHTLAAGETIAAELRRRRNGQG